MIYKTLFPGGKYKALTLSYDDGVSTDIHLMELMRQYGIKGTFNVNAGLMNGSGTQRKDGTFVYRLKPEEYAPYEGFELAVHGYTHPFLNRMPADLVIDEIANDRRGIEEMAGYPVHGMAYPYGTYNDELVAQLKHLGIFYSRTTKSTFDFNLPTEYLTWHPTCHHNAPNLMELADKFLEAPERAGMRLFYLWGHSYEFADNFNWNVIEDFFKKMGKKEEIWYATNMEIYMYMQAVERLVYSIDGSMITNPSAIDVWVCCDNQKVCIHSGETLKIK